MRDAAMMWLSAADQWETPGLALHLRFRSEVSVQQTDTNDLLVRHWWGAIRLSGIPPSHADSLNQLTNEWQDLKRLTSVARSHLTTANEAANLGQFLWICEQLAFLLQLRIVAKNTPLLTIQPTSREARLPVEGSRGLSHAKLSPYAFFRVADDNLVLESATSDHRILMHDPGIWHTVVELGHGRRPRGTEVDGLLLEILAGTGMLAGTEPGSGVDESLIRTAEFPDLLLHKRSRFGTHDGKFGAEFPFLGALDPPPPFPSIAEDAIALPVPDADVVRAGDPSLTEAIESRCSLREYSDESLTLTEIGEFLFRCVRVRGQYGPNPEGGMPYVAIDRPVPSGGGMHELEIYLVVGNVDQLPVGVYHYVAHRHTLELVTSSASDVEALLQAATRASAAPAPPPLLIKITSRFQRVAWKYRSIGYATTLKNVGVLYQTMYLVASAMGLAPCALGSGDEASGRQALGPSAADELGVGEFMLGHPISQTLQAEVLAHRHVQPTWRSHVEPHWGRSSKGSITWS
jgi:SagB-type dehydrogenase family enzyme